ncbi:MAG: hypothetical protein WCD07_02410 [Burkholderiales bacterium]
MLVSLLDMVDARPVARGLSFVVDHIDFSRQKFPETDIAFYRMPRLSDQQLQALKAGRFNRPALALKHTANGAKQGAVQ